MKRGLKVVHFRTGSSISMVYEQQFHLGRQFTLRSARAAMNTDDEAENPIEGFQVVEVRVCGFATQGISEHKPVRSLDMEVRWECVDIRQYMLTGVLSGRGTTLSTEVAQEKSIRIPRAPGISPR